MYISVLEPLNNAAILTDSFGNWESERARLSLEFYALPRYLGDFGHMAVAEFTCQPPRTASTTVFAPVSCIFDARPLLSESKQQQNILDYWFAGGSMEYDQVLHSVYFRPRSLVSRSLLSLRLVHTTAVSLVSSISDKERQYSDQGIEGSYAIVPSCANDWNDDNIQSKSKII